MLPNVKIIYGTEEKVVHAAAGSTLGDAVAASGLPLEQPCAGRGTCGKCKVLVEVGAAPPDEVERAHLSAGELAVGMRLACRARVGGGLLSGELGIGGPAPGREDRSSAIGANGDESVRIVLAPVVVYSNKIFRASTRCRRSEVPLGVAVDLGSTTVAAFLTALDNGEVCAGAASLNQQAVYGADVISRLAAAESSPVHAERLHRLAVASIAAAVDGLNLSSRMRSRLERVTVVGNVAMHHLLARLPVGSLAVMPFQPAQRHAIYAAADLMEGLFPGTVEVALPPLIGGFVGSDALACLASLGFADAQAPLAAIDLGTNGEVLVADGRGRILVASTAAGPAFEGVFIACGTRAVDGAITRVRLEDGGLALETIANAPPVGLTGSGLLSAVYALRQAGVIDASGRMAVGSPWVSEPGKLDAIGGDNPAQGGMPRGHLAMGRRVALTPDGSVFLTQRDVRELQKAKGAIRAAIDILLHQLGLEAGDLQRFILTGSFGGQVDIDAALGLGMLPPVARERVVATPNGAGLGAALFLSEAGFALGERLARQAEQVDLDQDPEFNARYVAAMTLTPEGDSRKL